MALVVTSQRGERWRSQDFRPSTLANQLKHLDVVNIGAAGTFVIRRPITKAELRSELTRHLPFDTEIMICEGRDIVRLMSLGHFSAQPVKPDIVRFIVCSPSGPARRRPCLCAFLQRQVANESPCQRRPVRLRVYRRDMKVISYLGKFDRIFGVPATTRNWSTITAIAKALDPG